MKAIKILALTGIVAAAFAGAAMAAQINTNGKLLISADDYTFSARVTARVQMDGNFYKSDSDEHELRSGTFMRRARMGVEGNMRDWEYNVSFDFATDVTSLEDGYVRHKLGNGKIWLGQFKVFEGFEEMTDSNDLAMMERSYVSEMAAGFKMGAAYNATIWKLGYSGNIYNNTEAVAAAGKPADDGVGGVVRGYFAPVDQRTEALHFGASYAYVNTDTIGDKASVRPIGRADEYVSGESFKFTMYDRKHERAEIDRFIGEAIAIDGPLYVQGQYLAGGARTLTQAEDTFTAWYGQVSYALTGEAHRYRFLDGTVDKLTPSRASGAWEINGRYQEARRKKVDGAILKSTDFGVTWYANANVRFMVDYGWADNQLLNDKPRLLSTRVQFDF